MVENYIRILVFEQVICQGSKSWNNFIGGNFTFMNNYVSRTTLCNLTLLNVLQLLWFSVSASKVCVGGWWLRAILVIGFGLALA